MANVVASTTNGKEGGEGGEKGGRKEGRKEGRKKETETERKIRRQQYGRRVKSLDNTALEKKMNKV